MPFAPTQSTEALCLLAALFIVLFGAMTMPVLVASAKFVIRLVIVLLRIAVILAVDELLKWLLLLLASSAGWCSGSRNK